LIPKRNLALIARVREVASLRKTKKGKTTEEKDARLSDHDSRAKSVNSNNFDGKEEASTINPRGKALKLNLLRTLGGKIKQSRLEGCVQHCRR